MNKKGNKAISELLGATKESPDSEWCTLNGIQYFIEELEFEEWDWLMPVVEYIENLNQSYVVSTMGRVTKILKVNTHHPVVEDVITVTGDSKKASIWEACVQFAEYYKKLQS